MIKKTQKNRHTKEMTVTTKDKKVITVYATEEQLEDLNYKNTQQDEEINQILLYPFAIILGAGSVWCLFALVIGITETLRKEKRR